MPTAARSGAGRRLAGGCAVVAAAIGLSVSLAEAQMQLPGAVGGGGAGSASHEGGGGPPAPPKPVTIEAPSEATIVGRVLAHDGTQGEMTFDRGPDKTGSGLVLAKLAMLGDKISKPGQSCTVNLALSPAVAAIAAGRPAGALRFSVPVKDCSFNIDVLDGAVLVTGTEPTCVFAADDCKVSPGGLWGPKAAEITAKQAQDLERNRVRLETAMRANFHALLRKAGKDRAAVKAIASQQAAFSSEREMTCRDYADEARHGFCSTQITQARALALLAQFGPVKPSERRFPLRAKPKPAADPDSE